MRNSHPHNLYIEANHLALRLSPGPWLVDTGSDVSFGQSPVLHLADEPYHVPESIGILGIEDINRLTRGNFVGVIGNDILGRHTTEFILHGTGRANGLAYFDVLLADTANRRKEPVAFVKQTSVPTVNVHVVGTGGRRLIFDTGAQYSYLESLEGIEAKPVGPSNDFVITAKGPVAFDVNLHEVTVSLGGVTAPITFATEPGKPTCPAPVGNLLKATGTDGILGWEILKHGPMAYLPRQGELWI